MKTLTIASLSLVTLIACGSSGPESTSDSPAPTSSVQQAPPDAGFAVEAGPTQEAGSQADAEADVTISDAGQDAALVASPDCSGNDQVSTTSFSWTYKVLNGQACATVTTTNAGTGTKCEPCTLDKQSDTTQCNVDLLHNTILWKFKYNPVAKVLYLEAYTGAPQPTGSWTPACQ